MVLQNEDMLLSYFFVAGLRSLRQELDRCAGQAYSITAVAITEVALESRSSGCVS